jgi:corrinoid protein of di/trimethylamine methyltransferase
METSTLEALSTAVQKGRVKEVLALIDTGLEEGLSAQQMLDDGMLKGLGILGVKFRNNEVFVPEVLVAARALNKGTEKLKPYLAAAGAEAKGVAVIGTVKGDLHDIGKNLVRLMVEGTGFEVVDLGVDVAPEQFVDAIREHKPDVLLLSALLTTTMRQQEEVVKAVNEAGLRKRVKIMVGGAPVTQEYCDQIGADAYTPDASTAADVAATFAGYARTAAAAA